MKVHFSKVEGFICIIKQKTDTARLVVNFVQKFISQDSPTLKGQ